MTDVAFDVPFHYNYARSLGIEFLQLDSLSWAILFPIFIRDRHCVNLETSHPPTLSYDVYITRSPIRQFLSTRYSSYSTQLALKTPVIYITFIRWCLTVDAIFCCFGLEMLHLTLSYSSTSISVRLVFDDELVLRSSDRKLQFDVTDKIAWQRFMLLRCRLWLKIKYKTCTSFWNNPGQFCSPEFETIFKWSLQFLFLFFFFSFFFQVQCPKEFYTQVKLSEKSRLWPGLISQKTSLSSALAFWAR